MAVEIIGEVASSHGGDRGLMEAFIAQCAEAGADWVKFQSYQVKTLRPNDPQREWLANAELSDADHHFLIETCARYSVKFLTTVFNANRVQFLATLGLEAIKVGSGEANERELAAAVRDAFPRVFVSSGLSPDHSRSPFVRWEPFNWGGPSLIYTNTSRHVEFFRCVSRYPCPSYFAHSEYKRPVTGWSDHARGPEGCQLAICDGATVIEKHVQLPEQRRPPRPFEATMAELKELRAFADDDPQRYLGRWQSPQLTA